MFQRFGFLTSARWLGLTAAAIVVVVVCTLLAQWQWGRAEERAEANARIDADGAPAALEEVLPAGSALDDQDRWTLVEATGAYDTDHEIVLRARTNDGVNGYEFATPLVLGDGTALLVVRGFIASDGSGSAPDHPPAPSGEVTVVGRLYESEPAAGRVDAEAGAVRARRLSIDRLAEHLGDYELRAAWIGEAEPADGFTALETPSFRAWQNYSYAVQWALFAALVPLGWVVLIRRELRGEPDGPVGRGVNRRTGSHSTAR
ncbi:SURF1 family cytochrome oxidase biogenesis protein [Glycomyces xiaoerkulensis]|uniref:SURF1 family cytochrome oxidase biogenesis protein n=1 Tax=Glycomyces xiaoerkulensis TaxID=2038139 RepID=UPI001300151F|nr:SURF1 family protein [Glycomyces xiaoerkulensis]